ncbi:glycosyltransferase [Clostridium tarantellae]|uniref:Glycosyltransferase n=1 Tax=Clostridium tarantellae TaxID=39493 RepID=A0A6I1MND7_9CLOT|nr:glycosyltransferase [Clostridium tarantellae]MPQ44273.1 glycosyltransferase [Clostridium tarantellae]
MKILQINSVCGVGSTGRIVINLYNILENKGHECVIAYGRGNALECIKTIKIGNDIDVYNHVAKTRLFDKHGFGSLNTTKKFIKEVEKYNPDIIHLHNIHGYYINIEILFNYLKSCKKPIVWTLHDCWSFTGHCCYFDYVGCYKWEKKCYECPQKKSYPSSILIDNSSWNFTKKKQLFTSLDNLTIVTPSNWLANLVKKSFFKDCPIKVINNGIDLNIFKPTESNVKEVYHIKDKKIILGVANIWDERKGLKYFLELEKLLHNDYKIIIVGLTEKQKEELPSTIIGITKTNSIDELVKLYTLADVFVNPTLEDNFPTTNLEALACGIPVITFHTGGSSECIDSSCGAVVEKDNINMLCKEIIKITNHKKVNYSVSCIKKAHKYYDKNQRFLDYLHLYIEILYEKK